jgi:hypothetical protein
MQLPFCFLPVLLNLACMHTRSTCSNGMCMYTHEHPCIHAHSHRHKDTCINRQTHTHLCCIKYTHYLGYAVSKNLFTVHKCLPFCQSAWHVTHVYMDIANINFHMWILFERACNHHTSYSRLSHVYDNYIVRMLL